MDEAMQTLTLKDELTEFLLYTTPNHEIRVETYLHHETLWLPQKKIAELFSVQRPAIIEHLKNIFENGELEEEAVSSILEHTAEDRKNYQTKYYNLDAILSVGYRVNLVKATQFRIWRLRFLKEYIIKGFAMDDERLKNGQYFVKIILKSFMREFVLFGQVRDASIDKLPIFLQSVVLIMIKTLKLQKIFMQPFKISFTLLSQVKLLPRLSMKIQILKSQIWDLLLGKIRLIAECLSLTHLWLKTIFKKIKLKGLKER